MERESEVPMYKFLVDKNIASEAVTDVKFYQIICLFTLINTVKSRKLMSFNRQGWKQRFDSNVYINNFANVIVVW